MVYMLWEEDCSKLRSAPCRLTQPGRQGESVMATKAPLHVEPIERMPSISLSVLKSMHDLIRCRHCGQPRPRTSAIGQAGHLGRKVGLVNGVQALATLHPQEGGDTQRRTELLRQLAHSSPDLDRVI